MTAGAPWARLAAEARWSALVGQRAVRLELRRLVVEQAERMRRVLDAERRSRAA